MADVAKIKVNDRSPKLDALAVNWPLLEALHGGTPAMRAAGRAFLPQFPKEADEAYKNRLAVATLYNAFRRTLTVMVGKPFAEAITINEGMPAQIEELMKDVDLEGRSLTRFSVDLFEMIMGYGLAGVLVDMPPNPAAAGPRPSTVAEEKANNIRPYFVAVRHCDLLDWKASIVNGVWTLKMVRYKAKRAIEQDWGTVYVEQVRVLTPGHWQEWEQDPKTSEFTVLYNEGDTTLKKVPFVPFYGRRLDYMLGESPLLDLAYLNGKHWQQQSDQDSILRVARVPVLAIVGAEPPDAEGVGGAKITIGAGMATYVPMGGDMKYVEHSGAAIGAGADALATLEMQMIMTGAELLVIKPGQQSATQSNNEAEGNKSDLQRIVEEFEDSLNMCLSLMAQWLNIGEDGGTVSLHKDFGASNLPDATAGQVTQLYDRGLVDSETTLAEHQRRGTLAPHLDVKTVLAKAKAEAPQGLNDNANQR